MLDDPNFPYAPESTGPGRPTDYSPELVDEICIRLSMGVSASTICLDSEMPCRATFQLWLKEHTDFMDRYELAKQQSAEHYMDEIIDISDDDSKDLIERFDKEGNATGQAPNSASVARAKLKIETRFKLAAKLKPKKYGEAQLIEIDDKTKRPETLPTMKQSVMNMLAKKRGQKTQQ